jgi:hypothetical protein
MLCQLSYASRRKPIIYTRQPLSCKARLKFFLNMP